MLELDAALNILCGHNFSLNVKTGPLYKILFKAMINRLLADPANYTIYLSIDTPNPLHQELYPSHSARIICTPHNIEPFVVNVDTPCIYIYYSSPGKILPETQISLLNSLNLRPNLRYIYVGSANPFTNYSRLHIFRYHWVVQTSQNANDWGGACRENYIRWKTRHALRNKSIIQNRKKNTKNTVTLYHFFVVYDNTDEKSRMGRFNKQVVKGKPRPARKPLTTQATASAQSTSQVITRVEYIYTNKPRHNMLLMPDGSQISYSAVVKECCDEIEI